MTFHTFESTDLIPFSKTAAAALKYNPDYIVRVNDDTEFKTKEWTSLAIATLQNFNPPNVGVVAPTCNEGNTAIFTHDMVHKTHLKIFNEYYPPAFKNWYLDDWITKVYGPKRSKKLATWIVKHHVGHHGTRYKVIDTSKHLNRLFTKREGPNRSIFKNLKVKITTYPNSQQKMLYLIHYTATRLDTPKEP